MRSKFWFSVSVMSALVAASLVGCGGDEKKDAAKDGNDPKKPAAGAHDHPTEGPHGGHLIELGKEEYHAELTHDDKTHTVTIYVLDSSAKKAVPIDSKELIVNLVVDGKPASYTLPAKPEAGEPAGQSSRFELADEAFMEALEAETTKGRMNLSIGGKEYTGTIEHHDHEGHKD